SCAMLFSLKLVTQIYLPSKARSFGKRPTENVPSGKPSEARRFVTVFAPESTVQMLAPSKATPNVLGDGRPSIVVPSGRSLVRRPVLEFATHIFVPSKAIREAPPCTGNGPDNTLSLTRNLVTWPVRHATQMFCPSNAKPCGPPQTGKVPRMTPSLARIFVTRL